MSAREQMFQSVRGSLTPLPSRTELPEIPAEIAEPQWLAGKPDDFRLFQKRAAPTGTKCFTHPEMCAEWLRAQNIRRICVPPESVGGLDRQLGPYEVVTQYRREEVDANDAAFTLEAGAIAESGTVILPDEAPLIGLLRLPLAALAPWHHVALLRRSQIHRTIARALAAMPSDPNMIWVSGPSKTDDSRAFLSRGCMARGSTRV